MTHLSVMNDPSFSSAVWVCGVLTPGKLLPSPKEAVAYPKTSVVWLVRFCVTVTKFLKKPIAELKLIPIIAIRQCMQLDMACIVLRQQ